MDKNFTGQNLNGRSFRGQDLRDADFSDCQLKSCDFSNADLTGAKFCRATMGVNKQRTMLKWALAFLLGGACGLLAWFFNYLFSFLIHEVYQNLTGIDVSTEDNYAFLAFGLLFAASSCLSVWAALKYRDWRITGWYYLVIIIVGAGAAMTVCYLLFGWYLNRRTIQTEEPMLALLHRNALAWRCWSGTQFGGATLAHTDFSHADLAGARFAAAKFQQPDFTHAKNLHLA